VPDVIGETQAIIRMVEDLPAPLGPSTPNASARRSSKSMPSTAVNGGAVLVPGRKCLGQSASLDEHRSEIICHDGIVENPYDILQRINVPLQK
jgi:hypothetical protein